jgi:hypothetical protein
MIMIKPWAVTIATAMLCLGSFAAATPVTEFSPSSYRWQNRLLLIYAPAEDQPDFQVQKDYLQDQSVELEERDLIVIEVVKEGNSRVVFPDQEPQSLSDQSVADLYSRYQVLAESFSLILVGKDGTVKRRSSEAVEMSVIYAQIDAMPMRQQEMKGNSAG